MSQNWRKMAKMLHNAAKMLHNAAKKFDWVELKLDYIFVYKNVSVLITF